MTEDETSTVRDKNSRALITYKMDVKLYRDERFQRPSTPPPGFEDDPMLDRSRSIMYPRQDEYQPSL